MMINDRSVVRSRTASKRISITEMKLYVDTQAPSVDDVNNMTMLLRRLGYDVHKRPHRSRNINRSLTATATTTATATATIINNHSAESNNNDNNININNNNNENTVNTNTNKDVVLFYGSGSRNTPTQTGSGYHANEIATQRGISSVILPDFPSDDGESRL